MQEEKEAFEKQQKAARQERQKADEKLQQVQAHLLKSGEAIKVSSDLFIPLEEYAGFFKYKIY